jgi:hypothetical protein
METEVKILEAAVVNAIRQLAKTCNGTQIHMILRYFCTNTLATLVAQQATTHPERLQYVEDIKNELTRHPAFSDTAPTETLTENIIPWTPRKSQSR